MCFRGVSNLPLSTPYTYMIWFENKSDKWVLFHNNGLMEKDPNGGDNPSNPLSQWVAPKEKVHLVFKGWTRHNYDFIQIRFIRCANSQGGTLLVGETIDVALWGEKLYQGHEDSIWTKHPDEQ